MNLQCFVKTNRSYTLGAHIVLYPTDTRKTLCRISRDISIDRWVENHLSIPLSTNSPKELIVPSRVITESTQECSIDGEEIKTNQPQTVLVTESQGELKIQFPVRAEGIMTDILFGAYNQNRESIPIKYLRAKQGDTEVLAINTSQLLLCSKTELQNTKNTYLYSHLPGKLNLSKLQLTWEVEFFSPQSQVSIYIYPRTWNILRFVDRQAGFIFLS